MVHLFGLNRNPRREREREIKVRVRVLRQDGGREYRRIE